MSERNFEYQFEWDIYNITKNKIKHNVDYKEIEEVFYDNNALITEDIKHSTIENRLSLLGKTKQGRLLTVFFTMRDERIRIISARAPNRKERSKYEQKT